MIDLHMHSRYSEDGEYTPLELVDQCAQRGVRIMSVTDHNCAKANEEAQKAAKEKGILYIPGIEIDCTYQKVNFHVLGYGIDFQSGDFTAIEKYIADHPLLQPYRPGGERSDNPYVNFYWDYYAQGKPCYAKIDYPAMEDMIDMIHRNHGAAVLAHPGVNLKDRKYLLEPLLKLGIDGIEAFSSYHSPEQAKKYYETAYIHNLPITCGSDYHGKTKPSIAIGQHNCPIPFSEMNAQLDVLFRDTPFIGS